MQHHPDAIGLVETDLDEVIPGAKVIGGACRGAAQFVVLIDDRNETSAQWSVIAQDFPHRGRRVAPSPQAGAWTALQPMSNPPFFRRDILRTGAVRWADGRFPPEKIGIGDLTRQARLSSCNDRRRFGTARLPESTARGGIALFVPSEAVDDGPGRQAGDCSKTPAAPRIDRLRPGPRLEAVACLARTEGSNPSPSRRESTAKLALAVPKCS